VQEPLDGFDAEVPGEVTLQPRSRGAHRKLLVDR
jgi:hypothetical protein